MKNPFKLIIGITCIGLAILIPVYFDQILFFALINFGSGWVITTILIRFFIILLVTVGLKNSLDAFKPKLLKNWLIMVIGTVIGFGAGFAIAPIYDVDYFMHNDPLKLDHLSELEEATGNTYERKNQYEVLAFLDVGCSHCQVAAQRLGINVKSHQQVPIHLFFNGDDAHINHFRNKNGVSDLPFHKLPTEMTFAYFAGYEYPSIFLIDSNGRVEYHWVAEKLNYNALDYLLSLEQ